MCEYVDYESFMDTFQCHICEKSFTHATLLNTHMHGNTCTEEKPFQCQICGKTFKRNTW